MRRRAGFTIVEMLVYMGLMGAFLVILGGIFFAILDVQIESTARSAVEQDGQYLLARLGYDVRRASEVTSPAGIGESGTGVTLVIDGNSFGYQMVGEEVRLVAGGESEKLNSYGTAVSDLTVTRLGNVAGKPSVAIRFTLTATAVDLEGEAEVKNFEETLTLR